jgi:hypothetical protein
LDHKLKFIEEQRTFDRDRERFIAFVEPRLYTLRQNGLTFPVRRYATNALAVLGPILAGGPLAAFLDFFS